MAQRERYWAQKSFLTCLRSHKEEVSWCPGYTGDKHIKHLWIVVTLPPMSHPRVLLN